MKDGRDRRNTAVSGRQSTEPPDAKWRIGQKTGSIHECDEAASPMHPGKPLSSPDASPRHAYSVCKAHETGSLRGQILDPTGAVIPGAAITVSQGNKVITTRSGQDSVYNFRALPTGNYSLSVDAKGFALPSNLDVSILSGQSRQLNLPLSLPSNSRTYKSAIKAAQ
jgi:hypothetical protein